MSSSRGSGPDLLFPAVLEPPIMLPLLLPVPIKPTLAEASADSGQRNTSISPFSDLRKISRGCCTSGSLGRKQTLSTRLLVSNSNLFATYHQFCLRRSLNHDDDLFLEHIDRVQILTGDICMPGGLHIVRRRLAHLNDHPIQHIFFLLQQVPIPLNPVIILDIAQRVPILPLDVVFGFLFQNSNPFENIRYVVYTTLLYV